jgi:hypothetical protein
MLKTLSFITSHPLTRDRPMSAIGRFVRWQIESRLKEEVEFATEVTAYGCTRSLASLESLIIAADFCTQTIASVAADGTVLADAAIAQGSGVGAALPIAGVAAAAAAAAAAGGGDGASSP